MRLSASHMRKAIVVEVAVFTDHGFVIYLYSIHSKNIKVFRGFLFDYKMPSLFHQTMPTSARRRTAKDCAYDLFKEMDHSILCHG